MKLLFGVLSRSECCHVIRLDETYLQDLDIDKLSGRQQRELYRVLDMELAIKGMKNNKSPGTDGLPVEFYKTFWNKIKIVLYNTYQEDITLGKLHL